MLTRCLPLTTVLLCVVTSVAGSNVNALRFTSIAVPGALTTEATGINSHGHVVGSWEHPVTRSSHGFLLTATGYQSFEVPGARNTYPQDINDAGTIVGAYDLPPEEGRICCESHGFVRTADGQFVTVTFPAQASFRVTWLAGINNAGHIVGGYSEFDETIADTRGVHGFLLVDDTVTVIDFPVPGSSVGVPVTYAAGINDSADIVGGYNDDETRRGYVLRDGIFNEFDVPGASMTDLFGINNAGAIVGEYLGSSGALLSFVFNPKKGIQPLTLAGNDKRQISFLLARSINRSGQIVGTYSGQQKADRTSAALRRSLDRLTGYAPVREDGGAVQSRPASDALAGSLLGFRADPPSSR